MTNITRHSAFPTQHNHQCAVLVEDVSDNDDDDEIRNDLRERQSPQPRVMETPQNQWPSASSLLTVSPDSAKKLLQTAVDALRDARQERESARQWAQDIKESVQQWVEEQQQLIQIESASATAAGVVSATSVQVQQLENSIDRLQKELARTNATSCKTQRNLELFLLKQEELSRSLFQQLEEMKKDLEDIASSSTATRGRLGSNQCACATTSKATIAPSNFSTFCDKVPGFASQTPKSHKDHRRNRSPNNKNSGSQWSETSVSSSYNSRVRRRTLNGGHVVDYGNGVTKEVHPDGTKVTRFANGDVETRFGEYSSSTPSSTSPFISAETYSRSPVHPIVAYFHSKEGVLQITQKDGSILYEYSNGQVERHYVDGTKVVLFPDGTKQIVGGGLYGGTSTSY
jgi:hypothetical protein